MNPLTRFTLLQGDVMRDAYQDFVKTHMALVKDENPTMSGRDVLKTVRDMLESQP